MAKLVAGTKYRGDFQRTNETIREALEVIDNIILFIDEIHMVIGAGLNRWWQYGCWQYVEAALTSGKLKVIGATTDDEYRSNFEKEAASHVDLLKYKLTNPTVDESSRNFKK